MTVLVGVLCQDGVVGSDGSATFTAGVSFDTVEQPAKKTFVVEPDVILAGTGAVGLAQRVRAVVQRTRGWPGWLAGDPGFGTGPFSLDSSSVGQPRRDFLDHLAAAKAITRGMIEDMASTHLRPNGGIGAFVAFPYGGECRLCEFGAADLQPEFKMSGAWFVSMGSGQAIADPFFGLLRRTLFRNRQPRLREGVFAAAWVLEHAIELNPGGINDPVQIGVLERPDPTLPFAARLLTEDELAEHKDGVNAVEDYLAEYRGRLNTPDTTSNPPPEPPDSG
ncbi:MAG: hypothetical protein K2X87_02445 [Gemmataceae bacterium]|nr:hypothetical protein [Gemmataceae bacterium]